MPTVSSWLFYSTPYMLTLFCLAWKVQYEGHGKGSFNAADGTHDNMEMQQYYFMMKKRKSALKEEGIN